jgi:ATP-dependent exoDNAse (exonuclease V) beta subunit
MAEQMATLMPIPQIDLRPRQLAAVESAAARIVVAAGPGSGKTRVLVERIARAVLGGRLRLDRVLAVTFTINAAGEMKKRLAERLPRAEVEAAAISTIHAFCASLLRQHPVESRVDPAFRVLEELEADVLKVRVIDALLNRMIEEDPLEFEEFSRHFNMPTNDVLLQAYEEVLSQGGDLKNPESLLPPEKDAREHLLRIARILVEFHIQYRAEKDRLSALDFADLEQRAWTLLQDDALAAEVAGRFDEILVDEYQDTSRLQAGIVERIVAAGESKGETRLDGAGKTRLFVVGDPKQSIYAFRNARPENFQEAIERARASHGEVIELVEDFRSGPEILAVVNEYFGGIEKFVESGYQPLEAGRTFPPGEGAVVQITSSEKRPEEARCLARAIANLVAESGGDYGGVAMLFRATPDMALYEQALAAAGVPYFSETGRGFYNAREVADVINMLHVLDNDRDEIALAAVLRSPMFGVSDDALYLLASRAVEERTGDREYRLCDVLEHGGEIDGLPASDLYVVRHYLEVRERLAEAAWRRPVDSLIDEILRQTGYEETLRRRHGGDSAVANVRKLAEIARALGSSSIGVGSAGEFARAVDHFRADEVREPEARTPESGGAVRLMTMHAAKGLEFPIVVLPDLGRRGRSESSPVDYHRDHGLGCSYRGEEEMQRTPSLERIRAAKNERNQKEEERLLFVAMTRAEDRLLLSGCETKGANKRYQRIRQLNQPQLYVEKATDRAASARAESVAAEERPVPQAIPLQEADQSDYAAAITDVAEFVSCPRRYYLGRYLGFSNDPVIVEEEEDDAHSPPDEMSASESKGEPRLDSASERGTAVHRRLAGEPAETPEIEALARRFEESALGRRLLAAPRVERESPILARFTEQEGDRFLHGVLDLRVGDTIVDYKTGHRDDRRYAPQMLLYSLLTGAKELYLFYLDEADAGRRASPVEVTAEGLAEARQEVRRFFAAQQTLEFPGVVAEHCVRCPFNGKQCREPQKMRAAV